MALKTRDYWLARTRLSLEAGEKEASAVARETTAAWKSAAAATKKELDAFFGRFAKDNKVSIAEARKRLDPKELKSFREQQALYLAEVKRLGPKAFTADYESYVRTLSAKAAVARMDELSANLRYQYEKASCVVNKAAGASLGRSYESGYYESMFGIQKGTGLVFDFSRPDTATIEKSVKQKWLGENYSDRIWKDKARQLPVLEREIQQGMARGLTSRQIAEAAESRCGVCASNALRLVATETTHIREEANSDAYDEAGIDSYEFDATFEAHTCGICGGLDGQVFKLSEKMVGVNFPPIHPSCRCTTMPHFDDIVKDGTFRAGRGLGGKTELLPPETKFSDWVNDYAPKSYASTVDGTALAASMDAVGVREPTKEEVDGAERNIRQTVKSLQDQDIDVPSKPSDFPATMDEKKARIRNLDGLPAAKKKGVLDYMDAHPSSVLNDQSEKHIVGTALFNVKLANALKKGDNYPAVFLDGVDLQKIYDQFSFTGDPVVDKNGRLVKEIVETYRPVGIVFGNYETRKVSKVKIHYKLDGTAHMVPCLKK